MKRLGTMKLESSRVIEHIELAMPSLPLLEAKSNDLSVHDEPRKFAAKLPWN